MSTDRLALIDGDPLVYAVAFALQDYALIDIQNNGHVVGIFQSIREAKEHASDLGMGKGEYMTEAYVEYTSDLMDDISDTLNNFVFTILEETEASKHDIILSGKENFRKEIDPEYKAHRKSVDKPLLYEYVRDMLVDDFGAYFAETGFEADDEIGQIALDFIAEGMEEDFVICTIDKDLDTIPGWHYRWPTHNKDGSLYWVDPEQARHTYWVSVLTGDTADNIPGLHGVGPKKAEKHLIGCQTSLHYHDSCLDAYIKHYDGKMEEEEIKTRFYKNMELLLIGKENRDAESYSGSD